MFALIALLRQNPIARILREQGMPDDWVASGFCRNQRGLVRSADEG
jgi:hypothetical protein